VIAKRTAIPLSPVLLAIAVAWGVFASPAVAAPRLSSAKHSVKAGGAVRLTGGGWGCSRDVTLTAYVDGVSPYGTLRIGGARVGRGGFAGRWTTPRLTDTLPWIVQGVQRCGKRTEVARTAITIRAAAGRAAHRVPLAATGATSLDARGLQLIADSEGFRLNAQGQYVVYNDPLGFCTAGYGHLLHMSNCTAADRAGPYNNLSPSRAVALLVKDANARVATILAKTTVPLTQDQLDALVDFQFNTNGYPGSALRRAINQGKFDQAPGQFGRWVHGVVVRGGKGRMEEIPGLVARRTVDSRLWTKGEFPPVKHKLPTGGGTGTNPTPNPPTPTPTSCSADNVSQPTPSGCYRVTFQVLLDHYPGDKSMGLGVGVGSATLQPSGVTITCLNPGDAPACVRKVDVPVNTTITITETPGSEAGDPATPADSAFEKFTGGCTGTGSCQLTPSNNNTIVDVYFIPAVATLTLTSPQASQVEMIASGDTPVATTDPLSPVYCGTLSSDKLPLPCSMLVRLNTHMMVEADNGGSRTLAQFPTFSNNCPAETDLGKCDLTVTSDQTVEADFGGV
jgi:GH24 family phage-related lysozyme (muramidase)